MDGLVAAGAQHEGSAGQDGGSRVTDRGPPTGRRDGTPRIGYRVVNSSQFGPGGVTVIVFSTLGDITAIGQHCGCKVQWAIARWHGRDLGPCPLRVVTGAAGRQCPPISPGTAVAAFIVNQNPTISEQRHRARPDVRNVVNRCPRRLRAGECSAQDYRGESEHSQKLHFSPQVITAVKGRFRSAPSPPNDGKEFLHSMSATSSRAIGRQNLLSMVIPSQYTARNTMRPVETKNTAWLELRTGSSRYRVPSWE